MADDSPRPEAVTADEWNGRYPVGTKVIAHPCYRGCISHSIKTETRSPAWTLGHGQPVVAVEGYAGGIALDHVDPEVSGG